MIVKINNPFQVFLEARARGDGPIWCTEQWELPDGRQRLALTAGAHVSVWDLGVAGSSGFVGGGLGLCVKILGGDVVKDDTRFSGERRVCGLMQSLFNAGPSCGQRSSSGEDEGRGHL
jgi:hypothetical protein